MADSVYISKNLSTEQLRFMKLMDEYELLYFNMQEVEETMNTSFSMGLPNAFPIKYL